MHISFAITTACEGFYPKNLTGYTITSFSNIYHALPLITLIISMCTSSFGMTKFFLSGPIPILPKNYPVNGLISLPFLCLLTINSMFAVRVICIENSFFSSYRYERHYLDARHDFSRRINPIIDTKYRILVYLTPCLISFFINTVKLLTSGTKFIQSIRSYPQILIASCFTPFMFQGCEEKGIYSIRIWKVGTTLNAFFIGCLPQVVLFVMDRYRGVTSWDFLGFALKSEYIWENNDALFKSSYGNSLFAVISFHFFFFLILLTFFTDKIFKRLNVYCKCLCTPFLACPNNCFDINSEFTPNLQTEHDLTNEEYCQGTTENNGNNPTISQQMEMKEV